MTPACGACWRWRCSAPWARRRRPPPASPCCRRRRRPVRSRCSTRRPRRPPASSAARSRSSWRPTPRPLRGNGHLVVMSHGSGGSPWPQADLAIALVDAGFTVAMPEHAGDNYRDMRDVGPATWRHRPREVSQAIDAMAADARFAPLLDFRHVGVYGMSAGGLTALTLAGARWSPALLDAHCQAHLAEDFPACVGLSTALTGGLLDGMRLAVARRVIHSKLGSQTTLESWTDPRITAAVAAVPMAATIDMDSIATPRIPLGLVRAGKDAWLAPQWHIDAVRAACSGLRAGRRHARRPATARSCRRSRPTCRRAAARLLDDPPGFDRASLPAVYARHRPLLRPESGAMKIHWSSAARHYLQVVAVLLRGRRADHRHLAEQDLPGAGRLCPVGRDHHLERHRVRPLPGRRAPLRRRRPRPRPWLAARLARPAADGRRHRLRLPGRRPRWATSSSATAMSRSPRDNTHQPGHHRRRRRRRQLLFPCPRQGGRAGRQDRHRRARRERGPAQAARDPARAAHAVQHAGQPARADHARSAARRRDARPPQQLPARHARRLARHWRIRWPPSSTGCATTSN